MRNVAAFCSNATALATSPVVRAKQSAVNSTRGPTRARGGTEFSSSPPAGTNRKNTRRRDPHRERRRRRVEQHPVARPRRVPKAIRQDDAVERGGDRSAGRADEQRRRDREGVRDRKGDRHRRYPQPCGRAGERQPEQHEKIEAGRVLDEGPDRVREEGEPHADDHPHVAPRGALRLLHPGGESWGPSILRNRGSGRLERAAKTLYHRRLPLKNDRFDPDITMSLSTTCSPHARPVPPRRGSSGRSTSNGCPATSPSSWTGTAGGRPSGTSRASRGTAPASTRCATWSSPPRASGSKC